jgi:glycosyltransferase involved in cell wall biosynthesis
VVTPVYNGEPYLAECIESVLAQTYENWAYVIVDNCSTDRSLEIAESYARREPRICIHNNTQFLPALQNLNHAFRQISPDSKYCKAVHADDWLFPECLARMVELAEANPSVGIVSAYRLEEDRVDLDGLPYPSTSVPGREVCRSSLLDDLNVFGSPTSLLIRSDVIRSRDPFYDESILHTDTDACYDILRNHDFGFVHQVLTFTRRHNESRTAIAQRFNTRRLAKLSLFLRHAPVYLTEAEYQQRLKRLLANYYRYLAKSVFELREKEFWEYHQAGLKKLGYPVSTLRLFKASFLELLDVRATAQTIRQAIARRRNQAAPQDTRQVSAHQVSAQQVSAQQVSAVLGSSTVRGNSDAEA